MAEKGIISHPGQFAFHQGRGQQAVENLEVPAIAIPVPGTQRDEVDIPRGTVLLSVDHEMASAPFENKRNFQKVMVVGKGVPLAVQMIEVKPGGKGYLQMIYRLVVGQGHGGHGFYGMSINRK